MGSERCVRRIMVTLSDSGCFLIQRRIVVTSALEVAMGYRHDLNLHINVANVLRDFQKAAAVRQYRPVSRHFHLRTSPLQARLTPCTARRQLFAFQKLSLISSTPPI